MQRPRSCLPHAALLVALVLPLLTAGAAAHHGVGDHPLMRIVVSPEGDRVTFTFNGTFSVQRDTTGRYIAVPMPSDATLVSFGPVNTTVVGSAEGDRAVHRFADDTPAEGAEVAATLVAERTIGPQTNVHISWRVPPGEPPFAEVRTPVGYGISQNAQLRYDFHGQAFGPETRRWSQSALETDILEVVLRPIPQGVEASHADPPLPGLGWLLVLAIGGLAGAAWYIGQRLERRKEEGP